MTPDAARALLGVAALLDAVVVDHPDLTDAERRQLQLAFEILTDVAAPHRTSSP